MPGFSLKIITITLSIVMTGCLTPGKRDTVSPKINNTPDYKKPDTYNFKFIGYDTTVSNPDNDRRSYYVLIIDKARKERTTTGLESQEKYYEGTLSPNRHLLKIEKWVLNKREGRYIKLNNISQPKPPYTYFSVEEDKIVIVKMKNGPRNRAKYEVFFEAE